ncbi:MAG: IS1182 family transposase [Chloroflexales bacterium]
MSLQPQAIYCVPEDTARVARAIFPQGNLVMRMYDELGMLFGDADFADIFAKEGQPAVSPVRLALVTLLQFWEGLTDRQAADAVRTRIDWKYLLCLELTDLGFHHTVLSEFRTRLLLHSAERRLFDAILAGAQERGLLKAGGRQRSDSTHVLGAVRAMTRLEIVTETLRHALNVLATTHPEWLRAHTTAEWVDRYGLRASEYRLPKGQEKRDAWAEQVGRDGRALLRAVYAEPEGNELREQQAIEMLRCVWLQNFVTVDERLRWRTNDETPPTGRFIGSPYDGDMRYATKRQTHWVGYKVHLTETYGDDQPNIITNVETTNAAVSDDAVTESIHASLAEHHLLPEKHIADTGYVNSELFVSSKTSYDIELIGPTRGDNHWQAKDGAGFAARDFVIDWNQQQAICPMGKTSNSWTPAVDRFKNDVIKIKFTMTDCQVCPALNQCTKASPPRRTITIRSRAQHEALLAGRQREQTDEYKAEYAKRAGVEGTIAQSVRTTEVRRSRYVGQAKTHLAHLMAAAVINIMRLLRWLAGEPKAQTRFSPFARLYQGTT